MRLILPKGLLFPLAIGAVTFSVVLDVVSPLRQALELSLIVVAWTIFIFTLNSRGYLKNGFLLFLGISFFFSGSVHLLHLYSLREQNLFPFLSDQGSLLFMLFARLLENTAFFLALVSVKQKQNGRNVTLFYAVLVGVVSLFVYTGTLPSVVIHRTLLLLSLQAVVAVTLSSSLLAVRRNKELFNPVVHELFIRAILLLSLSEIFYLSLVPAVSFAGDMLRLWAWYHIYKAVVKSGFSDPYTHLFSDLKTAQEAERTARKRAERRAEELEVLRANLSDMLSEHESAKLLNAILSRAVSLLDAAGGELGLVDRDKRKIRIEAVQSLPDKHLGQMVAIGEGVIGLVAQSRNPLILHGHGVGDGRLPQYPFDQWNGIMAVPLEAAGKLVGVLSLVEKSPLREFSQSDLELLTMFAQQAAMAIRTVQLLERARHQAETDSLTGLYNHRHFFEMSKKEVNRSIQENRSLSAIMFDIDFFKQVNDTYGHSVGDQVITSISNLCRQVFRKADIVGRYGGEEFSVILPDTDIVKAREVAERIRKGIEEIRFTSSQGTFSVSISVGLACLNRRCCSLNDLICRADEALYEAKDNGRNRICVWRHGLANSYRTAEQNAVLEVKPDQDNPSTAVRTE
ncbi:MAG: GGDEF domain-containing protein [Chitinispirillaceae bacterium]